MNKHISIYLDFLRFFAALAVFVYHVNFPAFYNIYPIKWSFGGDAVIIFFVLSGYVITYVANEKENNIKDYFISRFSRLYSALLPALLITIITFYIGYSIYPQIFCEPRTNMLLFRFLSNLTFTNQLWFHDVLFLSNSPLWSLGYEFWYYVLFAFIFYLRGIKRYLLALFTCLIMGPKILLLLPIWGMGVLLYYLHKKITFSHKTACIMFIASLLLIFSYFYIYYGFYSNKYLVGNQWTYSRQFIPNYILCLFISLNIFSVKYINICSIINLEKPIKKFASVTFSLYLYHFPLIFFFGALFKHKPHNLYTFIPVVILTLASIYILAQFTELKKHIFKRYITKIFNYRPVFIEQKVKAE